MLLFLQCLWAQLGVAREGPAQVQAWEMSPLAGRAQWQTGVQPNAGTGGAPGDGGTYSLRFSMEQIEITDQSGLTAMDAWSSHPKRTNYQASLGKENWVER